MQYILEHEFVSDCNPTDMVSAILFQRCLDCLFLTFVRGRIIREHVITQPNLHVNLGLTNGFQLRNEKRKNKLLIHDSGVTARMWTDKASRMKKRVLTTRAD